jgi:exodeoxyribonuclease V
MARGAGLRPRPLCRRASNRTEAGIALWKRLAYVAITRAEHRLFWVVRNRLARPTRPLDTTDLAAPAAPLSLQPAGD